MEGRSELEVEKEDVHALYAIWLCRFLNIHPSVPGAIGASPGQAESLCVRSDLFGHYPNLEEGDFLRSPGVSPRQDNPARTFTEREQGG